MVVRYLSMLAANERRWLHLRPIAILAPWSDHYFGAGDAAKTEKGEFHREPSIDTIMMHGMRLAAQTGIATDVRTARAILAARTWRMS